MVRKVIKKPVYDMSLAFNEFPLTVSNIFVPHQTYECVVWRSFMD